MGITEITNTVPIATPEEVTIVNDGNGLLDKIGGRKFLFAMMVSIFGFVLVLTGHTTAEKFFQFIEIVGATYIAGNVINGISDKLK